MQAPSSEAGWKRSESLHWKLSNAPIRPTVSKPCHADGWSSEHLHGWEGVADWPKTSRKLSLLPKRGYTSQISASSHGVSQEPDIITFIMIQALIQFPLYFNGGLFFFTYWRHCPGFRPPCENMRSSTISGVRLVSSAMLSIA